MEKNLLCIFAPQCPFDKKCAVGRCEAPDIQRKENVAEFFLGQIEKYAYFCKLFLTARRPRGKAEYISI